MKTLEQAQLESTCKKRVTVCEIYDEVGNLLSIESNRCDPPGGVCQRLNTSNSKSDYPAESCNWTHAEINAISKLSEGSKPYRSVLHGHTFYCDACEEALKSIGVKIFEIV